MAEGIKGGRMGRQKREGRKRRRDYRIGKWTRDEGEEKE